MKIFSPVSRSPSTLNGTTLIKVVAQIQSSSVPRVREAAAAALGAPLLREPDAPKGAPSCIVSGLTGGADL